MFNGVKVLHKFFLKEEKKKKKKKRSQEAEEILSGIPPGNTSVSPVLALPQNQMHSEKKKKKKRRHGCLAVTQNEWSLPGVSEAAQMLLASTVVQVVSTAKDLI